MVTYGDTTDTVGPKDKALELLANHHITFDPSSPEAKRLLRKIDMRIMPMIFTLYLLQLMVGFLRRDLVEPVADFILQDKNSLSFAAIMGIKIDAGLTSAQYSWLGSIV